LILDGVLTFVLFGFCVGNWFLAFRGSTQIEFWGSSGNDENKAKLNFQSSNDNLFRIFGTHKFFRILSPSLRNTPFTGLEYSFKLKDDGYDCNGNKLSAHDDENQGDETKDESSEEDKEMEMVLINQRPK